MKKIFVALALGAALVGCGGGGDDSPRSTPATATFPLEAAYKAYLAVPNIYSYGLSGSCGGSGSETTSAPVPGTFQGAPAQVKTSTLRITRDSCVAVGPNLMPVLPPGTDTVVSQAFYDASLRPLGEAVPAQNITVVYTGGAVIPATVKVGDSAVLFDGPAGSISYVVEADTETSVFVKAISFSSLAGMSATQTQTYRLTAAGALTLLRREVIMGNGISFVLTPR